MARYKFVKAWRSYQVGQLVELESEAELATAQRLVDEGVLVLGKTAPEPETPVDEAPEPEPEQPAAEVLEQLHGDAGAPEPETEEEKPKRSRRKKST